MKETFKIISFIFGGVILMACLVWLIIWIFTDPFNIVPDSPKSSFEIAKEECLKIEKIAYFSFNGRFVECKEIK